LLAGRRQSPMRAQRWMEAARMILQTTGSFIQPSMAASPPSFC